MLFGLASLPHFLGVDFFKTNNDFFGTPCNQLTSNSFIEKENSILTVFPNPAQTNIEILLENSTIGSLTIKLLNLKGDTIVSKKHQKLNTVFRTSFEFSNRANGLYFIHIIQEDKMEVRKVLIN